MNVRTLSALAILLLGPWAAGRPDAEPPGPFKPSARAKKELGERTVAVLSGATRVECFRLGHAPVRGPRPKGKTIGADSLRFPITATGKEKGRAFAARVQALLFDEATRTLSGASGARGDVALRLWKGKESVTVVIDFDGSSFLVVYRDADGKQGHVALGGFLFDAKGGFDKGSLFGRVKALAVEAFPRDVALKGLKKAEVVPLGP